MKVGKRIFLLLLALFVAMPGADAAVVLEVGSSGENVRKVQQRLIQYDYLDGEADGKYGEATRDAVILFQRRNGLSVDGRVGPDTAAALGGDALLPPAPRPPRRRSSPPTTGCWPNWSTPRRAGRATRGRWPWLPWC